MRTLRTLSLATRSGPAAYLQGLEAAVTAWTDARVPASLRTAGVTGARLTHRGSHFVLTLRRRRRAVAPMLCVGRVSGDTRGASVRAVIRPSRRWLWFPAIGTLLFLVQLVPSPPRGMALVGYAVVIGVLWAVNVLAAAMPVGSSPAAEAQALERLVTDAAQYQRPLP